MMQYLAASSAWSIVGFLGGIYVGRTWAGKYGLH